MAKRMLQKQRTLSLPSGKSVKGTYEPFTPGPNPKLGQFIREHTISFDPTSDKYDVSAFSRDLVVDKAAPPKAIYDMHSYWSKKHWAAIREYIRHYLPEKHYPRGTGLVLDCFSGSGMTGVAAMMENRPCVLIDASPAAAFISHCYTHPVDPEALQISYDRMLTEPYPADLKVRLKKATGAEIKSLQDELQWLYATKCDRCSGDATTEYVVYSERFQCPSCAEIVPLFDCPKEKVSYSVGGKKAAKTEFKERTVCPICLDRNGGKAHRDFVISTRSKKFGSVPVLVRYRCIAGCKPISDERTHKDDKRSRKARFFLDYDLEKITQIAKATIPHWYPNRKMMDVEESDVPWGVKWRAGTSNFRTVAEIYTKRNLWALSGWLAALRRMRQDTPEIEALQLAFTGVCLGLSRMNRYRPNVTFPLNVMMGTYYLPQISCDASVYPHLPNKVLKIRGSYEALQDSIPSYPSVLVSSWFETNDSKSLKENTVDFVFTDPAYVHKIQYGELNFVWESWLGFDGAWLKDEIVVNPFRNKTIEDWDRDMRGVLSNLYRALKPGRWLSLCYHDTDPETWSRVQNMLLDSGFEIHTVNVLDPIQKSYNQQTGEQVAKGDLVLNCLKPRVTEKSIGDRNEVVLVTRRVRDLLVEALAYAAGQTREHLWDIVLKRLLTRGQLAAHRFDDILAEVAFQSESGRWFLKEEFESLSESDVKNEEQAGAAITAFARLRLIGVPALLASEIVLRESALASDDLDEKKIERYIRSTLLKGRVDAEKFKLSGRMKGVEFYDCLFFYLTRWLKGRSAGKTPRRNLADFLDEYLVHFKDGDKWLYRLPDEAEAQALKKARQTGLGRRIRQFTSYLRGEGEYPKERMPDAKTLVVWLKHCASFGLPEEGVALFEKGGLAAQINRLQEDLRYDAEDYYEQCRRKAGRATVEKESDELDLEEAEE